MHRSTIHHLLRLAAATTAVAVLAGCNSNKPSVDAVAHAATLQQSMDAVRNNPHIPDQAKAQILASMQQSHGSPGMSIPH